MILSQITEAIPVIDKASAASDRWLFIGALVLLMAGGSAVIRWLVKSMEAQNAAHATERANLVAALAAKDAVHVAERKELVAEIKAEHVECRASRKEDQAAFLATLEKKDAALAANTKAVESLAQLIARVHVDKHLAQ